MKFLFDQNISFRILKQLPEQFQDSSHVKSENLLNAPDIQIWEFAKQHHFTIVTQDSDFNELNTMYGFPPKIIWIRTGNLKTFIILKILIDHLPEIHDFLNNKAFGCFEIVGFKDK